jgi:hypothetical protein
MKEFNELRDLAEANPDKTLEELTEMLGIDFVIAIVPQDPTQDAACNKCVGGLHNPTDCS